MDFSISCTLKRKRGHCLGSSVLDQSKTNEQTKNNIDIITENKNSAVREVWCVWFENIAF